ncbi:MAG: hypothetical protein A2X86_03175 [Bdellovibrionales bacterium GWA2_49_15]|nr:MAG: hypothetical protein A2X86_03175 [Bdellovibrionales bacterium GWA2_49_15]HAZ12216.1 hypothetical protein [Bdellovibrionales bacterium]
MKNFIFFIFWLSYAALAVDLPQRNCLSTREYVTSLNFLREQKALGLEEKDARNLADLVSKGCTGAAQRFIKTTNLLVQAELPSRIAITTAQEMSGKSDQVSENFAQIFAKVYLEKFFDLPASEALRLARSLAFDIERSPSKVIEDFTILSDFCLSRKGLDLPLAQCLALMEKVIPQGREQEDSVAKAFIRLFEFLSSDEKGPKMATLKAIEEGKKTIQYGPNAVDNFIQAYAFATSATGLGLTYGQGVEFAQKLSERTVKSVKKTP